MTIYFDDFSVGDEFELGSVEVSEADIVEFATKYDPQPFHIDTAAAEASPFGGLIASGWHTGAMYMRLLCDGLLNGSSSQGASGIEDMRWLAPVRPGDTLAARYRVEEVNRSATKPNRGTVQFLSEMSNQDGVIVLRMRGRGLFGTRP
ncbi:MAG: MaoC family dehydratase [Ilumatobacteraceae bacterium]